MTSFKKGGNIMSMAVKVLIIVALVAFLFISEMIPLAISAMGGAIACGLIGALPVGQVFSGLSNSTVVLFAGMFVIGASMFHTGLAQRIGEGVVKAVGTKENNLMFGVMVIGALMSAVSSNTGTTAALMPVVIGICMKAKLPVSRQLMPLAYGVAGGGMLTVIGTPPNLIVTGALTQAKLPTFGFFEFAGIGIPLTIAIIIYMMFVGKYLLPKVSATDDIQIDSDVAAEAKASTTDVSKQYITAAVLIIVVIVMGFEQDLKKILPINLEMAAVIGAIVLVLAKCITEKQAYQGIDWVTIFLFAGMLPIADAMDKTGAGRLVANSVIGLMGDTPSPLVLMAGLFLLGSGLTQFMSNTAATALLAPIGLAIAKSLGADPKAVMMAIAAAAASAYATPVGTPPNTIILGPGGYKVIDYVKVGTPLILVSFVVCMVVIPILWPFFPK